MPESSGETIETTKSEPAENQTADIPVESGQAGNNAVAPEGGEKNPDPKTENSPEDPQKAAALELMQKLGVDVGVDAGALERRKTDQLEYLESDLVAFAALHPDDDEITAYVTDYFLGKTDFDNLPNENKDFLKNLASSVNIEQLQVLADGLGSAMGKLKELNDANNENDPGAPQDLEQAKRVIAELKDQPKALRALTIFASTMANANQGSNMGEFIKFLISFDGDYSAGVGFMKWEGETRDNSISLEDFKNYLKKNDFGEKLTQAYENSADFQSKMGFDSKQKAELQKAKKGDKRALKQVMEALVESLFNGSDEDRSGKWVVIRKELGEKLEEKKALSGEVFNYFLRVYKKEEDFDFGDSSRQSQSSSSGVAITGGSAAAAQRAA